MHDKPISKKEDFFCRAYVRLTNVAEAAKLSGYKEKKALRLLAEPQIVRRCEEILAEQLSAHSTAVRVLSRLMSGSIEDAAALMVAGEELSPREIREVDLFNVSEIKRDKHGRLEVKFYDRLKAAALILEHQKPPAKESDGLESLITALDKGATAVSKAGD